MIFLKIAGHTVSFESDDPSLERLFERRFRAFGSESCDHSDEALVGQIVTCRAFSRRDDSSGWRFRPIHGVTPSEQLDTEHVVVTNRPLAVTAVSGIRIDVLQCEEKVPMGHLLHMIKYPVRHRLETSGRILLHTSSVVGPNGRAALFIGNGGAGKTTLFVECVMAGLSGLANDSIVLGQEASDLYAQPWPHVIRIGQGTINANTKLRAYTNAGTQYSHRDGKLEIFADHFDEILGRPSFARGSFKVGAIILPQIVIGGSEWIVTTCSPEDAAIILKDAIVEDRFQTSWLPGWEWNEDIGIRSAIAFELASNVPVRRVTFGTETDWVPRLTELLANL